MEERRDFWRGVLIGAVGSALAGLAVMIRRRRRERASPLARGGRAVREGAERLVEWSRGAARRLAERSRQ